MGAAIVIITATSPPFGASLVASDMLHALAVKMSPLQLGQLGLL